MPSSLLAPIVCCCCFSSLVESPSTYQVRRAGGTELCGAVFRPPPWGARDGQLGWPTRTARSAAEGTAKTRRRVWALADGLWQMTRCVDAHGGARQREQRLPLGVCQAGDGQAEKLKESSFWGAVLCGGRGGGGGGGGVLEDWRSRGTAGSKP